MNSSYILFLKIKGCVPPKEGALGNGFKEAVLLKEHTEKEKIMFNLKKSILWLQSKCLSSIR